MNKYPVLKQALIAIVIGATISFLTVLFEGVLDLLKQAGPALPGTIVGMGKYLLKWKINPTA